MKTLIILAAALPLASCAGSGAICQRLGTIAIAPQPAGESETADNRFDTPATVKRASLHNTAVAKACGLLPPVPPPNE